MALHLQERRGSVRLKQKEKSQAVIGTPSCKCTLRARQRGCLALTDGLRRDSCNTCTQKRVKKNLSEFMCSQKLPSHGSGCLPNFPFVRAQIRLCLHISLTQFTMCADTKCDLCFQEAPNARKKYSKYRFLDSISF